jgi:biopolymer transport protein ExbD
MKLDSNVKKSVRIEMLPLIDIVFLLLVFFIYAMLSMAVHRGLPVSLPESSSARIDKKLVLSVTVQKDGSVFVDKEPVPLKDLATALRKVSGGDKQSGVLLFADQHLTYQQLFRVLDQIRSAGLNRISLQAEVEQSQ